MDDVRPELQTDLFSRGVKQSSVLSEVWDISCQFKKKKFTQKVLQDLNCSYLLSFVQ